MTEGFNVGQLISNNEMGYATLNINLKGNHTEGAKPDIYIKGEVSSFDFKGYTYENIYIDGKYNKGKYSGEASLNDPNGLIAINGNVDLSHSLPSLNITASIDRFNPYQLHLTNKHENANISVKLKADFKGSSIDNLVGRIDIDSLIYDAPNKYYLMRNFNILAERDKDNNLLAINSEFMNAKLVGEYKFNTLPYSINNLLHKYLPTALPIINKPTNNDFVFDIRVINTNILSKIFDIPIQLY